ncbi:MULTISPECIES: hybrid sensor histidine kinase/response regulator [unclassified Tolypothrix]|uniref:hybrid sensor histidine kinase/response regulator n=1 Tax=unclassified Tolypothrix TaxID=2649714 RepID=UPI0005EAC049|nr:MULTISPECIES: response regulator [unclassified Tolypothrix]BAY89013.1 response regulator receiver signal transduction histidine kinase [Microchaete diplosiphon NIES-3275]EKF06161.1 response regulator [Tolypothrix sp. PCC 7601]MBE9080781.1 hybrid sensor histidine kinase/response regulator [Tolypothrix sp. LEGE 11397]UYD29643.1 hybrid sensor histidine kinase/response regulator [Tolypothrix sp. PCC 7712]UYD34441.1 hybrid sensor histidine kinase/response regulator [Tolypothrix sp. PCC 7601]
MMTDPLSKSMHILLVDDNPNNLKVLSEAIQGHGWKALMATDGESAIEQTEYAHPDLILLDVMMPGIDGFETCRRLKANPITKNTPIIFMTALSETTDKVKGLEIGAVDYITKPFQQEEVIARLKLHLKISYLTRTLEQRVQERTAELSQSIQRLQQTQLQLIQSEKMSTLGQLVAGIGHEINNPVGFLDGNTAHIKGYVNHLLRLIYLYQEKLPDPDPEIEDLVEEIDFEYITEDLPKLLTSMSQGISRLKDISLSLRTFARADMSSKVEYQIHEGIDSTLMLLKHRLKDSGDRPRIHTITEYGELPPISCYPGQLNQVFMNIIANAIDAFDEYYHNHSHQAPLNEQNTLTITTSVDPQQQSVTICIQDNGPGMPPEVQARVFEPSFTTKPVGKGTGLGLAISYQIIVDKHNGQIRCFSMPGEGTKFVIILPI